MSQLEIYYINKYNAIERKDFYNVAAGGTGGNVIAGMTNEQYEEYCNKFRGKNNPNYGKVPSAETRKKISESNKGKKISEEARKKLSEANRGRVHSEETRRKLSEANKGKRRTAEVREKYRLINLGRKHSDEVNKKKGRAGSENGNFNNKWSEEQKRKASERRKGKYVNEKNPNSKRVIVRDLEGNFIKEFKTFKECGQEYNLSPADMTYYTKKGICKKHKIKLEIVED